MENGDKVLRKIPLLDNNKEICPHCKKALIEKTARFLLKSVQGKSEKVVEDVLLYCPTCNLYFANQEISLLITHNYHGYYFEAAIYSQRTNSYDVYSSAPRKQPWNHKTKNAAEKKNKGKNIKTKEKLETSYPSVFLANAPSIFRRTCPLCDRGLEYRKVNVPVEKENGDFIRYYVCDAWYCYHCKKAYLEEYKLGELLMRIQTKSKEYIKLQNAAVQREEYDYKYIFYPIDKENSQIYKRHNYSDMGINMITKYMDDDFEELSSQSFLYRMGYNVSVSKHRRQEILLKAVKEFGERRVTDHISFLMETRRKQRNGENRYANALRIWQEDLNYIFREIR